MLKRDAGKLVFATIADRGAEVQLFVSKAVVGDDAFADVKALDRGDWVGAHGTVMTTRTGELSVKVDRARAAGQVDPSAARQVARPVRPRHPLPPALRRPRSSTPTPGGCSRSATRSSPASGARCTASGFVEVETPVLHAEAGGAHARPFVTHHNALDMQMYLRDRPRAAPQAADRRRHGAGLRDRPDLPQRRHVHPPQPRVHDDGVVRGVRRLDRRDGAHRGADHAAPRATPSARRS